MLNAMEYFIQYKSVKSMLQKLLEFIDQNIRDVSLSVCMCLRTLCLSVFVCLFVCVCRLCVCQCLFVGLYVSVDSVSVSVSLFDCLCL